MTAHEERILRATIDDPRVFDVPASTVRRLLALLDQVRGDHAPSHERAAERDALYNALETALDANNTTTIDPPSAEDYLPQPAAP